MTENFSGDRQNIRITKLQYEDHRGHAQYDLVSHKLNATFHLGL